MSSSNTELYQQVILEHNRKPRNFGKLEGCTNQSEGYNPLCGDHIWIYLNVKDDVVQEIKFEGDGCAICKASTSLMTMAIKGKTKDEARKLFEQFHKMVLGQLHPEKDPHDLGRLVMFQNIWQYPSRVKCAALSWHTFVGALSNESSVSTE
jgi:nitrogen fixation NifU-like protein